MEQEEALRIYAYIERPSSGYPGEEVGSSQPNQIEPGAAGQWHPFSADYWYRDANSNPPTNDNSSKVTVSIEQQYYYKRGKGNNYEITVRGWLKRIYRGDLKGVPQFRVNRVIEVWNANGKSVFGPAVSSAANGNDLIFEGRLYLGERTFNVGPQQQTPLGDLAADYRSYTQGYWNGQIPSQYLDQMHMGLRFVNDLPDQCDPPVNINVNQEADICDNTVDACLVFRPCSCEGMGLYLEYAYDGQSFSSDRSVQINASADSNNTICLYDLIPTNHTNEQTRIVWRAKYVPVDSTMDETAWTTGSFNTLFVLHPHEPVPDISEAECLLLQRGTLIEPYMSETCYGSVCADTAVSNPTAEANARSCRFANNVATTEDLKGGM